MIYSADRHGLIQDDFPQPPLNPTGWTQYVWLPSGILPPKLAVGTDNTAVPRGTKKPLLVEMGTEGL